MLSQWLLDPEFTYLNHGTVGATPVRVLRKQQALRDEMERQPARFMIRELNGHSPAPWRTKTRLREAIEPVAAFVGARADDLVFVPSVSTGLNAVLRSLPFAPGDDIIVSDLAYGATAIAARAAAAAHGATVRTIDMPFPLREPDQIVAALAAALTPRTKLAVVDHVSATTGVVLPLPAIAAVCHRHGVPVLVDGAHAPGSLALDIPSLGVDWYSANLHKWALAPRVLRHPLGRARTPEGASLPRRLVGLQSGLSPGVRADGNVRSHAVPGGARSYRALSRMAARARPGLQPWPRVAGRRVADDPLGNHARDTARDVRFDDRRPDAR